MISISVKRLVERLRIKGFVGPHYRGLKGKARFLLESTVARTELVFAATAETFEGAAAQENAELTMHRIASVPDLVPFRAGIDGAYYEGYARSFDAPFQWGEQLFIGTVRGSFACFAWTQFGSVGGFPTYYGRLFERDARILRVGVAPAYRRRGLNTEMLRRVLELLLNEGYARVFIECYRNNLPSVKSFLRVGFRPIGRLSVIGLPPLAGFIRWAGVDDELEADASRSAASPTNTE